MAKQSRVRRTESEWAEIMKQHEISSLSQAKFYKRERIAQSTFDRWHQRLGVGRYQGKLIQLALPGEGKVLEVVEVEFPSGVVLRIRG
mgnify:CR=1 FL=1